MRAKVYVNLKAEILDPQGKAVEQSLAALGFSGVRGVRVGKFLQIDLSERSREEAEQALKQMCEGLLANTVIEEYRFEVEP